ncbi:hypothetical protein D0860_03112 [Hortaea werneckii]|uniref:F-box domain-containing protein n=1 Tax=Hortaea werneckii TaxID=91943 RepID=A0A3M7HGV5_HORWE|nr:hypothetical protein D0860_03112 [Hortaea werneckii]
MPKYIPAWKRLGMTLRYKSADVPKDDQVFRFLDLPAEMRNLVYRELLVWPSNKPERCWPQILSTCRQVNDEAKHIIYTENAAKVKVFIKGMGDCGPDRLCWSLDYRGGRAFDDGDDDIETHFSENLLEYNFRCSPFLLQQTSVQVDIRLQGNQGNGRPEDVAIILSRVVYTFSSAFLHCEKLEELMRLEDSLDANEHAINIVTQAAYDEFDRPIRDCRDIYLDGFISLTDRILDHEEEKFMIDIIERLELWVKTTIQALERDAEVAKARIDAVMRKVRKVAELPES